MRLLILYQKKDLADLIKEKLSKDEAMQVIAGLRKVKMPEQFYNFLAEALTNTNVTNSNEEIDRWEMLLKEKSRSLKK